MTREYPDWDMVDDDEEPEYRIKGRVPKDVPMKVNGKSVFLLRDLGGRVPSRRRDRTRGPRAGDAPRPRQDADRFRRP